jgi:hypothetical protein
MSNHRIDGICTTVRLAERQPDCVPCGTTRNARLSTGAPAPRRLSASQTLAVLAQLSDGSVKFKHLPLEQWRVWHSDCPVCPPGEIATSTPARHESRIAAAMNAANFGRLSGGILTRMSAAVFDEYDGGDTSANRNGDDDDFDDDEQDATDQDDDDQDDDRGSFDEYERTLKNLEQDRRERDAENEMNIDTRCRRALEDAAKLAFAARLESRLDIAQRIGSAADELKQCLERHRAGTPEALAKLSRLEKELGYRLTAQTLIGGRDSSGEPPLPMI